MKRIKVTIVCSSLVRLGPTNVMYNMLEAYCTKRDNVDYTIVTISDELDEDSRIEEFRKLGIEIICCNIAPGFSALWNLNKIKKAILSTGPDIVLSYGFRCDVIVGILSLKGVLKVSSLFNNPFDDFLQFGQTKGKIMAKALMKIYKNFDSIIVCSKFIANKIKKYNLPLEIIYTGVPSSYFVPNSIHSRESRALYNIQPSDKIWLFIGNLIPRKNPLFLIDAFNKLNLDNQYLMIMGDGPLKNECVNRKGNNEKIILLGAKPGTLSFLQMADFYISSSYSEGFPTAVLEALSVGVIPVLSDIEPHKEMIEDFSSNCIFRNDDLSSLEKIMKCNINNTGSTNARDFLLNHYSSDIMQKKYAKLFNQLIIHH